MEISDKTKGNVLALEYLSNILNSSVSIKTDPASLLVCIRIKYDCINDGSYTEVDCSGHLCN